MTASRSRSALMALVAVAAAFVLTGVGWALSRAADFYTGGDEPEIDALRSVVPDSLLAVARADGSVHAHEVVLYAFVPHGEGFANAVLFTDSAIVRRSPAGTRRHQQPINVDMMRAGKKAWLARRGSLIVTPRGGRPDTLYNELTGSEIARLVAAATTVGEGLRGNGPKAK